MASRHANSSAGRLLSWTGRQKGQRRLRDSRAEAARRLRNGPLGSAQSRADGPIGGFSRDPAGRFCCRRRRWSRVPDTVSRVKVGPFGRVVEEDIFPDFVVEAQEKIQAGGWRNARTVVGTEHDPKLPLAQFDVAIVLDTYHHFNYPAQMLRHIRAALKSSGRLIIIEYYRSRPNPSATDEDLQSHIRLDRDGRGGRSIGRGVSLNAKFRPPALRIRARFQPVMSVGFWFSAERDAAAERCGAGSASDQLEYMLPVWKSRGSVG